MKMNQIADVLNNVIMVNITGEGASADDSSRPLKEDLTNIVDVGKTVLDFTNSDAKNFNNFVATLIDQVGRVVFWDRVYTSKAPNIMVDSWEYGSIMMKTRVEVPEFTNNVSWKLADIWADAKQNDILANIKNYPTLDPFELNLPEAQAKFYNAKDTYECPITLAEKQLKSAFRSPEDMQRFIATIENRIQLKKTLANDALIFRTIANFMGLKILQGNYIDLLASYNSAYSQSLANYDAAVKDAAFLRYAATTIDTLKAYMQEASYLFSKDYITFTPDDRLQFLMLKDFESKMRANLYSNTFNEEYVKLDGYQVVNDWQGLGTTANSAARRKINIKCTDGSNDHTIAAEIVAVLFDRDGCAVCNEDPRTTSQYNPRGEYTNFFYKWDANYLNDDIENGVVFVIGSPSVDASEDTPENFNVAGATADDTSKFWGVNPANYQSNITVTGNKITGTLTKDTNRDAWTSGWGKGYFLALTFSGTAATTDVKVGLVPSQGSGFANLDSDKAALFKIKNTMQSLHVIIDGVSYVYDLSGLTLA